MKIILSICASFFLVLSSISVVHAQSKTTYRDASGRTTGSSTRR